MAVKTRTDLHTDDGVDEKQHHDQQSHVRQSLRTQTETQAYTVIIVIITVNASALFDLSRH